MKFIIVAGTPGSGKTAVLIHTLKVLKELKKKVSVVKIDCLYTDDDKRFAKLQFPTLLGLSKDMCPDHFSIYNTTKMVEFAEEHKSDILVMETAGLCHRCAPYTNNCLGICVIDATTGPNTPRKVGPFLSTADVVAITKGDVVSQAEREIFRERIIDINPAAKIFDVNGLSGMGSYEIADQINHAQEFELKNETLRHNAPLAICTLCVGEKRVDEKYHRGILRRIDGFENYIGE
jgi:Ni2+-binding GTPase involved in maturation of urease and hydrogenase